MKKDLKLWQFAVFCVVSLMGTLLHYLYNWIESPVTALLSGVNESTFEHMKLLYVPMLIFALVQYLFFKERKDYWCIKLIGSLSGTLLIPVIFYTYNGAFGKSPDWLNIAIFFVCAAVSAFVEYVLFKSGKIKCRHPILPFAALIIVYVLFAVFTFYPPKLPLFMDPVTFSYGI